MLRERVHEAYRRVSGELVAELGPAGHWTGELSSSALSTATAVIALAAVDRQRYAAEIEAGLRWLASHPSMDGGWGDTIRSRSNPSTTALAWAAFGAAGADARFQDTVGKAETCLAGQLDLGEWSPRQRTLSGSAAAVSVGARRSNPSVVSGDAAGRLVASIERLYGKDRTFSVPITMALALSGRLGPEGWTKVRALPFEVAVLPRRLFGALRLPVVSYALPALIAIGQVIHQRSGRWNPLRDLSRKRTLGVLASLQPAHGGFLEATPLTSFVTMSLAGMGRVDHVVTRRGTDFLKQSVRSDGSWPIDTNLATWVTTLAVKALRASSWPKADARRHDVARWLRSQQHRVVHPYTGAAPGGWAWTDLPGGVPDADDTAGALLALRALDGEGGEREPIGAVENGIDWLLDLQNADGGIPTFCRGWGALPFDQSTPEITAHALRAWATWRPKLSGRRAVRVETATTRAMRYLGKSQRGDGAWLPLWFGNEAAARQENPVYGTAQTLIALNEVARLEGRPNTDLRDRAAGFLRAARRPDGSWGGDSAVPASVEETAVAVEALSGIQTGRDAMRSGVGVLVDMLSSPPLREPAPIGLYFARLWYFERLYPLVFSASALAACLESEEL